MAAAIIVIWSLWCVNMSLHGVQQHHVDKLEAHQVCEK